MTFDLGLARNLSDLGLVAGINYIYLSHMTASITFYNQNNYNHFSIS